MVPIDAALERLSGRIDWERRDRSKGWRVDLEPARDLVSRLGRPDQALQIVHVTGSKGKGSVASLIARGLMESGHRVGIYGSPHVETIHERVRIDGECIADAPFAAAITAALDAWEAAEAEGTPAAEASWFDIVTVAGLVAFRDAGVDWAVLEVGLGGRLDSTNVIDPPEVAVVTNIELEHTAILGDTRAKIAAEKGGILKAGSAFVTGCAPGSEAAAVLVEMARDRSIKTVFAYESADLTFEARNVRVARAALEALNQRAAGAGYRLADSSIAAARLPGRMERRTLRHGSLVVPVFLDGAHVESSVASALAEARALETGKVCAVIAIHGDKEPVALLRPLAAYSAAVDRLIATTIPSSGVHRSPAEVAAAARGLGIDVQEASDPSQALAAASRWAEEVGQPAWIFGTGSLYLAGALRPLTLPIGAR